MDDIIVGQKHLIGENAPLTKMIENNKIFSFIIYGPSGVGKTTIANYVANKMNRNIFTLNAVNSPKKEFEEVLHNYQNQEVILVVDEVHRLDKIRQNLLLPYLEKENIILIGTTTEDPTYHLHSAFRSRVLLFKVEELKYQEIFDYIMLINKTKYQTNLLSEKIIEQIVRSSGNDIRKALQFFNFLVLNYKNDEINDKVLQTTLHTNMRYLKKEEEYYDVISAFQKSIRASDLNASIFYLAKLLLTGDYNILLRRLVIIAYEDIGIANASLVTKVYNAISLFKEIGMPEGRIILANIVVELALSPKSTSAYKAVDFAIEDVKRFPNASIPPNIRQNKPEDNPYIKEEAFYQDLLPKELKGKEYVVFGANSKYEKLLEEAYIKLKKEKNDNR